ncbi:hypothetical protein LVD17_23905 [Fulvivirga ulvae]|uniref:ComEC/Rec2 family competence protein n=1 Tax=Fulvivirga ulvae TaxID=2904245 RepID=UPI001F19847D|nr:hypothetical protein [Fulvivirga ulvae]UII31341.1 hypothetical protein LVD17_23905 [Fulvivirga ulvae]
MSHLSTDRYNGTATKYCFAEFPSIKIYKNQTDKDWNNHLLFGDYIKILDTEVVNNRIRVRCRGNTGWVKVDEIRKDRLLEINFVDIGQGDGCHVVTPDDQHFIVDAGKGDNMERYLSWRFNLYDRKTPLPFLFKGIISHSDLDHYGGFKNIFKNDKINFDKIYHNCLVERPGDLPFGEVKNNHILGLVRTNDEMRALIGDQNNRKGTRSTYCKTLYECLKYSPDVEFIGLLEENRFVQDFDGSNTIKGLPFSLKVLGPIHEGSNGRHALRTINNTGKDKNGHSLIIKLQYDKARMLLGGDVNSEFGEIICNYYKSINRPDELEVDAAKACHHGSNHFNYDFLEAVNSAATIISSGDDESYAHPRPDAIGAFGKCGYGKKPLIFSTELARSNVELTMAKLKKLNMLVAKAESLATEIKKIDNDALTRNLKTQLLKTNKNLNSYLTKYGMINLRTDGSKMIIAQKLEKQASYGKWDIHKLEYSQSSGRFELSEAH